MQLNKLVAATVALLTFACTISFAQIDSDLAMDMEALKDVQTIVRKLETQKKPVVQEPIISETDSTRVLYVDEEAVYGKLTQDWDSIRSYIYGFRSNHRSSCEQNTDLKGNEWGFLNRVSHYIQLQTHRIRDTYTASQNIELFAQTSLQLMEKAGDVNTLRPGAGDRFKTDLKTAAANVVLSDMVLQSQIEEIKSEGVWDVAGVPLPKRIIVAWVKDSLMIYAWHRWAKAAVKLSHVKRTLNSATRKMVVRLSVKNLPQVCRGPKTLNACAAALKLTRRGAFHMGGLVIFQGGAILPGIDLWSEVWSRSLNLFSWYYVRAPLWKERLKTALGNYDNEIKDLCFYRACYENRVQKRVAENRERKDANLVFSNPNHEHYHLKQYCSSYSDKRGSL